MLPDAWQEPNLSHPHNIILDFWLRLGILGVIWLVVFVWVWGKTAWRVYQYWFATKNKIVLAVMIGIMGSMANLFAHGLVDNSLYVLDLAMVFAVLVAIVANVSQKSSLHTPHE